MFCPQCGSTQSDELRFCKACGANLGVVRDALSSGVAPNKFDWSKTWVAEMFQSGEEAVRKAKEIERLQGITPETKRRNEIKAGVITASVGIGIMIFLYFLMQGIILGGKVPPGDAEILSRIWLAGIIPFMVGTALIINGAVVSKVIPGRAPDSPEKSHKDQLRGNVAGEYLPPADTSPLFQAGFSVTDETTEHLKVPRKQSAKDAN
jgi:hypothetical protein